MRKDVTGSLLFWPSVAVAVIAGVSYLSIANTPVWQLACRQVQIVWHRAGGEDLIAPLLAFQMAFDEPMLTESPMSVPAPEVLHADVPPSVNDVEIVERAEQGEPAMRVPDRLVSSDTPVLYAPRIDEFRETAGLLLDPASELVEDVADFTIGLFAGDVVGSDQLTMAMPDGSELSDDELELETSDAPMIVLLQQIDVNETYVGDLPRENTFVSKDEPEVSVRKSVLPSSISNLGDLASRQEPVSEQSATPSPSTTIARIVDRTRKEPEPKLAGWPPTPRLHEELDILNSWTVNESTTGERFVSTAPVNTAASIWVQQVDDRLDQLRSLDRLADPQAGVLIDELDQLAIEGFTRAENLRDRYQQIQWLRTAYAVSRRVAVWRPIFQTVSSGAGTFSLYRPERNSESVPELVRRVRADLPETGDAEGWNRFLLLDQILSVDSGQSDESRQVIAKRLLSRLRWHGLDPRHVDWLDRDSIIQLTDALRPWTSEPVDYVSLLTKLEQKETEATALSENEIVDAFQTLRFTADKDAVGIATALNTHYRNANVRVAVSEKMLQRVLPRVEPQTMPVRTNILGSRVHGVSRVKSDLQIKLQPSADRWSLLLNTTGNIVTNSVGRNGPAALSTTRHSGFVASTPLVLTRNDVNIGRSRIDVNGRTRLRRIRTNYDGWPLLGQLVQRIVQSRYRESLGLSNRIANRKTRTHVATGIEQRLNEQFGTHGGQFEQLVLGPLGSLDLDPMVVDMQTTDQRLLARYRVAGDWQLGAFTPRPRAPRSSLMSVQIHQSAINNTLEQIVPRNAPKSIEQMITDAAGLFGRSASELPGELPEDVEVQFAPTRPITFDVQDGVVSLTMRIVRLRKKDRIRLSHFSVKANYLPEVDGIRAYLVRDGHLRISGPRMSMRERLPVRAIFNKILSQSRKIPLTLSALVDHPNAQDLAVSQLELRDGWIGMAISQQDAPRIAIRHQSE